MHPNEKVILPGNLIGHGGPDEFMHTFHGAQAQWFRSISTKDYIDTHCWRFTPNSFRLILSDLQMLALTGFGIAKEFDTVGYEFYVSLDKNSKSITKIDRLTTFKTMKFENA